MGVSKNNGTPKSSILIGFSIINHPFWGTTIFGNIHILHKVGDHYNHLQRQTPHDTKISVVTEDGTMYLHVPDLGEMKETSFGLGCCEQQHFFWNPGGFFLVSGGKLRSFHWIALEV